MSLEKKFYKNKDIDFKKKNENKMPEILILIQSKRFLMEKIRIELLLTKNLTLTKEI